MNRKAVGFIIVISILTLSTTFIYSDGEMFTGLRVKDMYPLQHILKYKYINYENKQPLELVRNIIKELDIENNERYFKTGVKYVNGSVYEIPIQEIADFGIKAAHTNTYCNIFVIDVLNIVANTLKDESYRIATNPINANNLRTKFEESPYWMEVSRENAIENVQNGRIVVLSYVEQPHGHVAFLNLNSKNGRIFLWNVGAENSNNLEWTKSGNTKYFVKIPNKL